MPNALTNLATRLDALDERWPGARRRAVSLALVLAIELALLLALLTLGTGRAGREAPRSVVTTFDAREAATPSEKPEPVPEPAASPAPAQPAAPMETAPDMTVAPRVPPPPVILQTPAPAPAPAPAPSVPLAKPRITAVVRSDRAGPPAPTNAGAPGDSERIAGSGPNGEPLYRARWYREPYPDELRGYLSTTPAPAWALINCQTQPQYRVDHCVLVEEYPRGSNMGSAVLNAAWQFKVRPPRVGGRVMVGEWVRIRIEYTNAPG